MSAGQTGGMPPLRHERIAALLDHPDVQAALVADPVPLPPDALAWLAQICLLDGIPFDALVPAAAMLPPESIRFFHVDQNWLDALVDGTLSIANVGTDQHATLELVRQRIRAAAHAATSARRPAKLAAAAAPAPGPVTASGDAVSLPPPATHWSGLLLRSTVVADFPGLSVKAYPDAAGTQPALTPLRVDNMSSGLLIAIFDGVAQRFEIAKPAHVLHFGVKPVDEIGPPFEIQLRGIHDGDKFGLGVEITGAYAPLHSRVETQGAEVVDVLATVGSIEANLAKALNRSDVKLNSGLLGIELVQATECAVFIPVAIIRFEATPPTIAAGATSTLSWEVVGATTCTIDPDIGSVGAAAGTHVVSPTATTTYTLNAVGADFTLSREITVTVGGG